MFITAGPITKLFAGGGGGEWTTCAMIDDEPRPVWMWKCERVCVYYCRTYDKAVCGGGGGQ